MVIAWKSLQHICQCAHQAFLISSNGTTYTSATLLHLIERNRARIKVSNKQAVPSPATVYSSLTTVSQLCGLDLSPVFLYTLCHTYPCLLLLLIFNKSMSTCIGIGTITMVTRLWLNNTTTNTATFTSNATVISKRSSDIYNATYFYIHFPTSTSKFTNYNGDLISQYWSPK